MRLQAKVLAVSLPLGAAFVVGAALVARTTTERLMVRELAERLLPEVSDFARRAAPDVAARHDSAMLQRLLSAKDFAGGTFAETLDPRGRVLSHTNVLEIGTLRNDPSAAAAIGGDGPRSARTTSAGAPILILSAPIWRPEEDFLLSGGPRRRIATFRLGLPLAATLDSAQRLGTTVAVLAAGLTLVGVFGTVALLGLIVSPVRAIAAAIARVAAGDYKSSVPVLSSDELGDLAVSFNSMSQTLSHSVVSRDKLEQALATARATLEASADGILVVDEELRAITYNNLFLKLWGIPDDLARTNDVAAMARYVSDQAEDPDAFLKLATAPLSSTSGESRSLLRLRDGRVFERISRPFVVGERTSGRTVTTRDMTLHHQSLRAVAEARDQALEAARVRTQFLANVSHELRTPLNAVVGASQLLLTSPLSVEQREHASVLQHAATALLALIDDVLDFSKIEAGKLSVDRTPLRPIDILRDSAALLQPRAAEKGLALRLRPGDGDELRLIGDAARLKQVMTNLLTNAVKFTEKGEVTIGAAIVSQSPLTVGMEFSITDTGIGISPENASKMFTPFHQGDGTSSRRFGGTGLGLAISKSLVDLMGGTIAFESSPGAGSRFWFRVSLARADGAEASTPLNASIAPRPQRDRLRVLVVEDNSTNRLLVSRQLTLLGCPLVIVPDGHAALQALAEDHFGLVLLDCQMPGFDGFQTAAEIRRREAGRRHVPIAAFTASATEEDRRHCLNAGMDDFIPKPVTLESLAQAIERWDLPFDEPALKSFLSVTAASSEESARLLNDFLTDAAARIADARAACSARNRDALRRAAHSLKGASAAVGAYGMRELARRLEAESGEGTPEHCATLVSQADAERTRLSHDVLRRFGGKGDL